MDISYQRNVCLLYKIILRLHKGLPEDLQSLGTKYVKEEFKRHKNCDSPTAAKFIKEWTEYATMLSKQLSVKGIKKGIKIGSHLDEKSIGDFREDQVIQLYELMKASTGTFEQPK